MRCRCAVYKADLHNTKSYRIASRWCAALMRDVNLISEAETRLAATSLHSGEGPGLMTFTSDELAVEILKAHDPACARRDRHLVSAVVSACIDEPNDSMR